MAFIDAVCVNVETLQIPDFEEARKPLTVKKSVFFQEAIGLRRNLGLTKSLTNVITTASRLKSSRFISLNRPFRYLAPKLQLFPRYRNFCNDLGHLRGTQTFTRTPTLAREA